MATKYRVNFSTNTGADIKWRININNVDYSGTVLLLKSQGEPITIDWPKDRDIYKPIRGSSANLNLILEDGDTLDDFNSGGQYTWEVDLQYQLTDDTWKTYWRGWIDPVDGEESVGSYPIDVSFTATDQLGLLAGSSVREYDGRTATSLVGYIQRALLDTGLGLDLYVDSGINYTGGDALDNLTIDERIFLDEENLDKRLDRKEAIEGILKSFNCSLFQSDGAFWVINNSTHGGSGNTETNSFTYYEFDDEGVDHYNEGVSTNVNLRKNLTSSVSTDLRQSGESLYLTTQQPYGSVEAVPKELKARNFIQNSDFTNGSEGWTTFSSSHDTTLFVDTTESINGNAIRTNRNVTKSIATNGDVWFYNNDNSTVERDYPMKISFDWAADIKNANVDNVELRYALVAEWSDQDNVEYMSYDWYTATYGQTNQTSTVTTNRLQYNWRTNSWHPVAPNSVQAAGSDFYKAATTSEDSVWSTHEETVKLISHIQPGIGSGSTPSEEPYIYIYFYYPVLLETDGGVRGDSTNSVSVYVDNINIRSDYKQADYEPFFERVQSNYHTTLRYEPLLMGDPESPSGYYNTLSTSSFNRNGAIEDLGLEELVTQQKLNDYREQMKYYQGKLINNTTSPLGLHHKVAIEYDEHDELNDGYGSCVVNGGTFSPKMNMFEATMHTPNQGSDVTSDFSREDVDLIGAPVPDRESIFTLVIQPKGVDDDGNEIKTPDSEGREDGDDGYVDTYESLQPSVFYIPFANSEGTRVRGSLFLDPIENYEISGTAYQTDSSGNLPSDGGYENTVPSLSNITFTNQGLRTYVEFDVTVPNGSVTEILYVEANVDETVGNNVSYTVTKGTNPTGVTVTSVTDSSSPLGSVDFFQVFYTPDDAAKEITTANATLTATAYDSDDNEISDVVGTIQEINYGTGIQYIVPVTCVNNLDDITLTHTATTTDLAEGVTTATITISAAEGNWDPDGDNTNDTSNWHIQDTSVAVTGVVGTRYSAVLEVQADGSRYITPDHVDLSESDADISNYYVVFKSHQEYHIFVEGTMPGADKTANVTVRALTQTNDPAAGSTATVTFNKGTDPSNTEVTAPGTQLGIGGGKEVVNYYVLPTSGKEIKSAPTATVTDSDSVTGTGVWIESGTGWIYQLPFTYPTSGTSTVSVSFNTTVTDIPDSTITSTVTVVGSEGGSDTINWQFADSSVNVTEVSGTRYQAILEVEAQNSRYITPDSVTVSVDSDATTITNTYVVFKSHTEYHVIVEGTTPNANDTDEGITVSVTTQTDDPDLTTGQVSFTNTQNSDDGTLSNITVGLPLTPQSGIVGIQEAAVYVVGPDKGYQLNDLSASDITVTNTSGSAYSSGVSVSRTGTGYIVTVPFTYASSDATVNISINATAEELPTGTTVTKTTLTASESGSNTDEFLIADTSVDNFGVSGDTGKFTFQVEAVAGYVFTSAPTVTDSLSYTGTWTATEISKYEYHLTSDVTFADSDQTGTITISASTSDDDGEEVNHVVITPAADDNWSYVANEDPTIGVDPGDTTTFGITIEGDPGVDVSGVTLTIPDGADDWLEAGDTQNYVLDNSAATGKTFFFTITGKPNPSSITLSKGGSTDDIKAITLTMFLDSTDSGIASVSKSHLKWTYSSADSGALPSQSFTVQSNDPLYAYNSDSDFSAGEHYVYTDGGVATQNGSSSIGTFNVTKSRSGGVFTFTVTPTIGTSDPSDGSREGYFVLAENSRPFVSASSGNIYAADATIQSHAQNVMIGVEGVNGSWRVTRPSSDSSIVPTNPAHHNASTKAEGGTVTAAFTTNNGSTSRSVTFSLYPSSDGLTPDSGASAISTLTITQASKDFTPKAEGDYTMVISDSDPGAGTSDDVITFVM